jgi:hypothetical protein
MKTDDSGIKEKEEQEKLLKFICPNCGSHRLEEIVLMRQEIEGVYDPEDPNFDWDNCGDDMVVFKDPYYALPGHDNCYRCYDCEITLTDEECFRFWNRELLYRWLKGLPLLYDDQD